MDTHYTDPHFAFEAHQGLQPVKAQLRSCAAFLSSAVPGFVGSKPFTAESYRVVLKAYAIALDGLDDVLAKLVTVEPHLAALSDETSPAHPDVQDDGIEARADSLNALQGLTEFAILRVGQLVGPMELHKLPPGKPGDPGFESHLKVRSELYCSIDRFIDALQRVLQYLVSPLHDLSLGEEHRGEKFREAKKEYLVNQIKGLDEQLEEVKMFVAQVKETRAKLEDELATVDQTTLFTFPDDESVLPGTCESGTPS